MLRRALLAVGLAALLGVSCVHGRNHKPIWEQCTFHYEYEGDEMPYKVNTFRKDGTRYKQNFRVVNDQNFEWLAEYACGRVEYWNEKLAKVNTVAKQ